MANTTLSYSIPIPTVLADRHNIREKGNYGEKIFGAIGDVTKGTKLGIEQIETQYVASIKKNQKSIRAMNKCGQRHISTVILHYSTPTVTIFGEEEKWEYTQYTLPYTSHNIGKIGSMGKSCEMHCHLHSTAYLGELQWGKLGGNPYMDYIIQ